MRGAARDRHETRGGMRWTRSLRETNAGRRGRRSRVVLAPVAGVKFAEVLRARPGLGRPLIRGRRWQDEFVAGERTA